MRRRRMVQCGLLGQVQGLRLVRGYGGSHAFVYGQVHVTPPIPYTLYPDTLPCTGTPPALMLSHALAYAQMHVHVHAHVPSAMPCSAQAQHLHPWSSMPAYGQAHVPLFPCALHRHSTCTHAFACPSVWPVRHALPCTGTPPALMLSHALAYRWVHLPCAMPCPAQAQAAASMLAHACVYGQVHELCAMPCSAQAQHSTCTDARAWPRVWPGACAPLSLCSAQAQARAQHLHPCSRMPSCMARCMCPSRPLPCTGTAPAPMLGHAVVYGQVHVPCAMPCSAHAQHLYPCSRMPYCMARCMSPAPCPALHMHSTCIHALTCPRVWSGAGALCHAMPRAPAPAPALMLSHACVDVRCMCPAPCPALHRHSTCIHARAWPCVWPGA